MPVVSMSKKEFDRLEVLLGVRSGRLRVADACQGSRIKDQRLSVRQSPATLELHRR
jgi:hypothetical protein